jgi:hypothetical protein
MEQRLLAQGAGNNSVINVYPDRVEFRTGWNSENADSLGLKQIANVSIRGLVNCTLPSRSTTAAASTSNVWRSPTPGRLKPRSKHRNGKPDSTNS